MGGFTITPAEAIALGLGGGAAGAFGTPSSMNTSGTTQSSQSGGSNGYGTQNTNSLQSFLQQLFGSSTNHGVSTTTPNLNPQSQAFINNLIGRYSNLTSPSLSGYQAQQTQGINNNSNLQSQAVNSIMASRGLATSPVAATSEANIQNNRIGQINSLNESIPILKDQLDTSHLNAAGSFASSLPNLFGSTSTSDNTGTTSQSSSGQQTGYTSSQFWNDLTNYLNSNSSTQQQQNGSQGGGAGSGIGGFISTLLGSLKFLSDKNLKKDIKPVDKAIERLRNVNAMSWKWKGTDHSSGGVLAQDLEKEFPELIENVKVNGVEVKSVNYAGLIPYLIDAVKSVDKKVEALA